MCLSTQSTPLDPPLTCDIMLGFPLFQLYALFLVVQSCQGQSTVKSVINYSGRGDRRGDRNMSLNIALVL